MPGVSGRYEKADVLAGRNSFRREFIKTFQFELTTYYRFRSPGKPLTVYIEGDGFAWATKRRLSNDPTPRDPLVMKLAAIDTAPNVAYIARPGQYSKDKHPLCNSKYWSSSRFSDTVISSTNQVIDSLLEKSRSDKVRLIGYSGGAAIAALIAARRSDVISLRTVAGNLDTAEGNRYHRASLLEGSLNPIDIAPLLKDIPQHHFVGKKDTVVPRFIVENFIRSMGGPSRVRVTVVDGAAHTSGWAEQWPELLALPISDVN